MILQIKWIIFRFKDWGLGRSSTNLPGLLSLHQYFREYARYGFSSYGMERELLVQAKQLFPRFLVEEIDLLIVDKMGKEISGSMVAFMNFLDIARGCGRNISIFTEETFMNKDYQRARELQASIIPLLRAIFEVLLPLGFRLALGTRGFQPGLPRHLLEASETGEYKAAEAGISKLVKEFGIVEH